MPVLTRHFRATDWKGIECLAAVRVRDRVVAGLSNDTPLEGLQSAFGDHLTRLEKVGRGFIATLTADHPIVAESEESSLFRDQNVMVAVRNGETAEAASDWLTYHANEHGADAALIFDRDPPGQCTFAANLAALDPVLPVTVVTSDRATGLRNAPDARDPALAPGARNHQSPPIDPWHAPLAELALFDLLRRRFLATARAVVFLDIADLLLPVPEGNVFDRAVAAPGLALTLQGVETYPWRLRQGRPAPHADHIAHRHIERRRLLSWCAAPQALPANMAWMPGRLFRVSRMPDAPAQFRRALGVVFPGAPVNALVRKADLAEDPSLVSLMAKAFPDASPIRLPDPGIIPPRPETNQVCVVTAMKNEGPFLLDWIAHNRAIGIDRHLVYTNDCEDGTDRLLDLLAEAGVTRRDNPYRTTGKVPQYAAFRAAESEDAVTEADWLLTLDVDEYINIHVGQGLVTDLMAAVPDAHVISMPWRLFGNADQHSFTDAPVTQVFTRCAPAYATRPLQAWAFKSLYRNEGLFRRLGVHRPKGLTRGVAKTLRWVDATGRDLPPSIWRSAWRMSKAQWGYDLVTVNHYAVRSAESFLVKRERGRVNHTTRDQGETYWFRMNHNAETDTSIARLDPRVADQKAALMELPGIVEAHEAAVAWHRRRIEALKAQPDYAALYASLTSPRLERLSRMATFFGGNVHYLGPGVIPDDVAARDPAIPFYFTVDVPQA